jgi:hypothetical protein
MAQMAQLLGGMGGGAGGLPPGGVQVRDRSGHFTVVSAGRLPVMFCCCFGMLLMPAVSVAFATLHSS